MLTATQTAALQTANTNHQADVVRPDPDAQQYVAYYRVSTQKQGRSGLGLEDQEFKVKQYVKPLDGRIIAKFIEVESGKKSERPELAKAIEHANEHGATLLVAKLDRLARDVGFTFFVLDSLKAPFAVADMPSIDTLTLGMFATLAQYEAEMISERTKNALAAKQRRFDEYNKRHGLTPEDPQYKRLGNPNGWTDDAQEKATAAKRRNAKKNSNTRKAKNRIRELVELAQFKGQALTIETVAERLNDAGLRTTRAKKFTRHNVRYLLDQVLREMQLTNLPK